MQRDSFIFFKDWANVIRELPNDVRLDVYDAVIEYGLSGKQIELKPMAKIAFGFIKQTIDRNNTNYKKISEIRSESGKKGAEKRWQKIANDSKNSNSYDNDNDNVKDNDNENVNGSIGRFAPPTLAEVAIYFLEKGYTESSAKRAFEYYSAADWKDSNGKQVKNWKQKMIAVWFKPENEVKKSNSNQISMY